MLRVSSLCFGLGLVLMPALAIRGQEPAAAPPLAEWADPDLPVTRGLALWLDAERLEAARAVHDLPAIADGDPIAVWHDGSGHGRHLTQPNEEARPPFKDGALRFDGETRFLERRGAGLRLEEFTLFLVAAPLGNAGGFRGLCAFNQEGQHDYTSGLTVDQGFAYTQRFETLNVEGKGFSGMADLMTDASEFGVVRRLAITSRPGAGGTMLEVDGQAQASRDRDASVRQVDRITVGARRHGAPLETRGFFDGDLFHVLLYDRALDAEERRAVDAYLAGRLGGAGPIARREKEVIGTPLEPVADPPPVQILAPGFAARELPVKLTNINNIKYRHDGKLVALAYDGDLYLLSDEDGDGLEETVARFWENDGGVRAPIGMALTPPGDPRGDGVFVTSKGKVSLFLDRDRDDEADEEIIVATGWEELPHGVDAVGVAVDDEGHVYFGIGTTSFTNPYLIGPDGHAAYRLDDEHGTILKVAPDFQSREVVATGIRFSIALAFNRHGDLFATDQEGATWLPNGNPFDELLHIQPGRHYGFPPRHPAHLPDVIDEPSVFDYRPQHQSTCGLNFNEPVFGGPIFGPARWAGDALVTGYARGKLFRTALVKTDAGYVARNQILAVLGMLPADACISPAGDLVVAAHSGLPDWGSGPKGEGKLYKLSYIDPNAPQPVVAWSAGPREMRLAFDRPLEASWLEAIAGGVTIEYGEAVQPGDRFESHRPGYEVVGRQLNAPRFELPVHSTQVTPDRRTLILATAPHTAAQPYAITLPGPERSDEADAADSDPDARPQHPDVDFGLDLSGVEADWRSSDGSATWSGWLPHLDLEVARRLTEGSAEHDRLWAAIDQPGRLTLKTQLELWQMLRPAVQPGSTIDYSLPDEVVTLRFAASGPIEVTTPTGRAQGAGGPTHVEITTVAEERELRPIELTLATGDRASLELTWSTQEDARPRALPLRRMLVPWSTLEPESTAAASLDRADPELEGGDWARGRALFFGDQARCGSCHAVRGEGEALGPDLSNLVQRDYASVLRDIETPNAALNPDYITHTIALTDGRVLQGTLRNDGARLIVGDTEGREIAIDRANVEASSPASVSIMPEGLLEALTPEERRDLLTFLLTEPPDPREEAP